MGAAASGRAAASAANACSGHGEGSTGFGGGEGGKDGEHSLGAVITGTADGGFVGFAHGSEHFELVAAIGAAVFVEGHSG